MKVADNSVSSPVVNIRNGECFTYSGNYYLLTSAQTTKDGRPAIHAVRLTDGYLGIFNMDTPLLSQ